MRHQYAAMSTTCLMMAWISLVISFSGLSKTGLKRQKLSEEAQGFCATDLAHAVPVSASLFVSMSKVHRSSTSFVPASETTRTSCRRHPCSSQAARHGKTIQIPSLSGMWTHACMHACAHFSFARGG